MHLYPAQLPTSIASTLLIQLYILFLLNSQLVQLVTCHFLLFVNIVGRDSVRHKQNNGGRRIGQGCTSSTMSAWLTNQLPVSIMTLHLTDIRLTWRNILDYKRSWGHVPYLCEVSRQSSSVANVATILPSPLTPWEEEVSTPRKTGWRIFFLQLYIILYSYPFSQSFFCCVKSRVLEQK